LRKATREKKDPFYAEVEACPICGATVHLEKGILYALEVNDFPAGIKPYDFQKRMELT